MATINTYNRPKDDTLGKLVQLASVVNSAVDTYAKVGENSDKAAAAKRLADSEAARANPGDPININYNQDRRAIDPNAPFETLAQAKAKNTEGVLAKMQEDKYKASLESQKTADPVKAQLADAELKYKGLQIQNEGQKIAAGAAAAPFQNLPEPKRLQINKYSEDITKKQAIKDQVDSIIEQFDSNKIPDDQKLVLGEGSLKTLNSDNGPDAVGTGEAKRLSPYLNYNVANMTGPGPFIGRDLNAFADQLRLTSTKLGLAIQKHQDHIDELTGNPVSTDKNIDPAQGLKKTNTDVSKQDPAIASLAKKSGKTYEETAAVIEMRKRNAKAN